MVSQLLVASGVAAACGFLGVNEWLRTRAGRTRAGARAPHLPGPRRATYDRVTPLEAMTGYRRAVSQERVDG